MAEKLELVREEKLYKLLPGKKKGDRLEASGVALVDDSTAVVIFDNLNLIARVELSLEPVDTNRLIPAPSLAEGFEDIAIDHAGRKVFCIIESMEDTDGKYRGFLSEYDDDFRFQRCSRLSTAFDNPNKGFEGLAYARRDGHEYILAMCEGNLCTDATSGGGRIQAFKHTEEGNWEWSHQLELPLSAEFEDYAGISYRDGRLAVVSQASARVWIAEIDREARLLVDGSQSIYRFPKKSYGNVEGIAWLSEDMLVCVSDKKKTRQPEKCAAKDQSIHIFRIPSRP
jgi:hypothetical protein